MHPVLVVTGPAGVGKSHMVHEVQQHSKGKLHIVDGLDPSCTHFVPPSEPAGCHAVVVDHIELGQWALAEDAYAWCEKHDKKLWVVAQSRQSMEMFIPEILEGAVEMQLAMVEGQVQVTYVHDGQKRVFSPSEELAAGIVKHAVGK